MSSNRYQPPGSELIETSTDASQPAEVAAKPLTNKTIYSLKTIHIANFVAGPIAAAYPVFVTAKRLGNLIGAVLCLPISIIFGLI